MSTQWLPRGPRSSSIPRNPLLTFDLSACPAADCNLPCSPTVADAFYCRLSEVVINILQKQARKLSYNTVLEEFSPILKNIRICDSVVTAALISHTWGHWLKRRSTALASTFYEHQITTNRPCLVTVSQVKRDFLPPQCPARLRLSQR